MTIVVNKNMGVVRHLTRNRVVRDAAEAECEGGGLHAGQRAYLQAYEPDPVPAGA